LELDGSLADLRWSLLQTAVVGGVFWGLLYFRRSPWARLVVPMLLVVTALDLAIAQRWLVPVAPDSIWQDPGLSARAILARYGDPDALGQFRVYRGARRGWLPRDWAASGSDDRLVTGLQWDVDTMVPKYPLTSGLSLAEAFGTFSSADFVTTLRVARRRGWQRPDRVVEPHPAVLDAMGVRYLVLPGNVAAVHAQPLPNVQDQRPAANTSLWMNPRGFPRAWIVHDIEVLPPLRHSTPRTLDRRTREVWFPGGVARTLLHQAVIETEEPVKAVIPVGDTDAEHCHLRSALPQRVDLDVQLQQPGVVVLSDLYYPGWFAMRVDEQGNQIEPLPVFRTNRFMRGVWLPAGKHRVSFRYYPTDFYLGAAISVLAWLGLALAMTVVLVQRNWLKFFIRGSALPVAQEAD
jgi:hypothetical protein